MFGERESRNEWLTNLHVDLEGESCLELSKGPLFTILEVRGCLNIVNILEKHKYD